MNTPAINAPVVCLPGLLGDARVFEPLFDVLADTEVSGLDLPPGSFTSAAKVIAAKLEAGWDSPVHLVTGSFGGLIALSLPESSLVRSITTIGTMPDKRFFPNAMARLLHGLKPMPSTWVETLYRQHISRSLARDGVPRPLREALSQRTIRKQVLLDRLTSIKTENPTGLDVPTLWLTGVDDDQTRWSDHDVVASYPKVIIDSIPGAHRPYASHPEALANRLRSFWRDGT